MEHFYIIMFYYRLCCCAKYVYTRASLTNILARKIASVGQVGEDPRACPARGERSYSCGKLNREVAGHADILATILARMSARISVSVSVSAPWNASCNQHSHVLWLHMAILSPREKIYLTLLTTLTLPHWFYPHLNVRPKISTVACAARCVLMAVMLKFHGGSFLVASSWHLRENVGVSGVSARGFHEDATRKLFPWNFSFSQLNRQSQL